MKVYRIAQAKYSTDLSGEGARLFGGRWNRKGSAVLYSASNSSLAMLEKLVHIPSYLFPSDLKMMHLELPQKAPIATIAKNDLPALWKADEQQSYLRQLGDQFVKEQKALGLVVPSIINEYDTNVILNVHHTAFAKVKIEKITDVLFDKPLFK